MIHHTAIINFLLLVATYNFIANRTQWLKLNLLVFKFTNLEKDKCNIVTLFSGYFMENEIQLKIEDAYPIDVGRGIIRLDPTALLKLQLSPGDIAEINGKKKLSQKCGEQTDRIGKRELQD